MRLITLLLCTVLSIFAVEDTKKVVPLAIIDGNPPQAKMHIEISSEKDLATLRAFFPGYEKSPTGKESLAMDPKYIIKLPSTDGKSIKVCTDGKLWYITSGYWEVNGDLEKFLHLKTK